VSITDGGLLWMWRSVGNGYDIIMAAIDGTVEEMGDGMAKLMLRKGQVV
jgi:hypothetical protein